MQNREKLTRVPAETAVAPTVEAGLFVGLVQPEAQVGGCPGQGATGLVNSQLAAGVVHWHLHGDRAFGTRDRPLDRSGPLDRADLDWPSDDWLVSRLLCPYAKEKMPTVQPRMAPILAMRFT